MMHISRLNSMLHCHCSCTVIFLHNFRLNWFVQVLKMNYNFNYVPGPGPWYWPMYNVAPIPVHSHHSYNPTCYVCGGLQCCAPHYSLYPPYYMMKRRTENSNHGEEAPKKSFWATGLLAAMDDPKCVVKEDDTIVIIKDKYPKAEFHFLVLPKENISNINKLTQEHIPLLEHMEATGQLVAKEHPDHKFRFGYHAIASMFRLHLHVISDDFNSLSLKTKKHWNSFTTPFFITSQDLIDLIKKNGKVNEISRSRAKELMETPLQCHKCSMKFSNMPKLKQHLLVHRLKEKHASEK